MRPGRSVGQRAADGLWNGSSAIVQRMQLSPRPIDSGEVCDLLSEKTEIAWTDATFSPWWGCAHVSPGCVNCYAEKLAVRWGHDVWGKHGPRRLFGDDHWRKPLAWNHKAEKLGTCLKVFCASMADVFEEHPALDDERAKLWPLIEKTLNLDWQILTKRPENVASMVPVEWTSQEWPRNVWLGTSIEDQIRADERIPILSAIHGAAVRFLSVEPLVGPVSLASHLESGFVDWIIVGGESGPNRREMDPEWLCRVVDDGVRCGIPVFVKQDSGRRPGEQGRIPDDLWALKQFPRVEQLVGMGLW